jgi:ABC-type transporter Mla subunit MlaD
MNSRLAVSALIAVALLGALGHALSQRPPSLRARFATAEDLAAGAPVRARGAVVGKLAGVQVEPAGTALVEMQLGKDTELQVPADSVAILAPGGVDLVLGDAADPAGPDTVLKGYRSLTEFRLDSARSGVNQLLDRLQGDAEKLGKTLQEKGAEAGEVLRRELDRLRRELEETLPRQGEQGPGTKAI